MEKNVNPQLQAAPSPKFNVELRELRPVDSANQDEVVLVCRENVDFSVVTAFLAVMGKNQYVAISYPDAKV